MLIKVNGQWNQRGGTNTDLLRSFIQAIIDHPHGFAGEIVADNRQRQYGAEGNGGSMDWDLNNAEERSQSVQDVVDAFAATHRVSASLGDTITGTRVAEYAAGDVKGRLHPDRRPLFNDRGHRCLSEVSYGVRHLCQLQARDLGSRAPDL